ncbi:unnamed protein product, partial [Prorocentrum cordatum]
SSSVSSCSQPDLRALSTLPSMPSAMERVVELAEEVDEDCFSSGCCNVAGLTCFETKQGKGECLKNCTPSETKLCKQPQEIMEPVLADAVLYDPTLYCFAIVMQDIGSTKKYYDLELLQGAYDKGIGIFGCDSWGVFSDAEADLAPGVPVTKVDDVDGDFHFAKREETGTWLNTGLHYQAWKAIQAEGKYAAYNWVVKLDADAVMITSRLKYWLSDKYVPPMGIYLENCQYVNGWLVRKPGDLLEGRVRDAPGVDGLVQGRWDRLEGGHRWRQVWPHGRGSVCAGLPGRQRRQARDRIRLQAGRDVRGGPAPLGKEEQEVEA